MPFFICKQWNLHVFDTIEKCLGVRLIQGPPNTGFTVVVIQKLSSLSRTNTTQLVTIIFDSKPTSVLCHMGDFGCGDGGWTPVMKMDGKKVRSSLCQAPLRWSDDFKTTITLPFQSSLATLTKPYVFWNWFKMYFQYLNTIFLYFNSIWQKKLNFRPV